MATVYFAAVWPSAGEFDRSVEILVDEVPTPNLIMNELCQIQYPGVQPVFANVTWITDGAEYKLEEEFPGWTHPWYLRNWNPGQYRELPHRFIYQ